MTTLHAGVPMISKEQSDIALLRKDIERIDQRIDELKDEIKSVETRIITSLRWSAIFIVSVVSAVIAFLTFWPLQ